MEDMSDKLLQQDLQLLAEATEKKRKMVEEAKEKV